MTRSLVIYYSWTGHTAEVAEAIAKALSADIERIEEVRPRAGALAYIVSGFQAGFGMGSRIKPISAQLADYDVVILGCPVWAQSVAAPMRSFLARYKSSMKRVAVFCTEGAFGGEKALRKIADLCGQAPVATLLVTEPQLKTGEWRPMADKFVHDLNAGARAGVDAA